VSSCRHASGVVYIVLLVCITSGHVLQGQLYWLLLHQVGHRLDQQHDRLEHMYVPVRTRSLSQIAASQSTYTYGCASNGTSVNVGCNKILNVVTCYCNNVHACVRVCGWSSTFLMHINRARTHAHMGRLLQHRRTLCAAHLIYFCGRRVYDRPVPCCCRLSMTNDTHCRYCFLVNRINTLFAQNTCTMVLEHNKYRLQLVQLQPQQH
jgi:hypothetical protein